MVHLNWACSRALLSATCLHCHLFAFASSLGDADAEFQPPKTSPASSLRPQACLIQFCSFYQMGHQSFLRDYQWFCLECQCPARWCRTASDSAPVECCSCLHWCKVLVRSLPHSASSCLQGCLQLLCSCWYTDSCRLNFSLMAQFWPQFPVCCFRQLLSWWRTAIAD